MARLPRILTPDLMYHITARGVARRVIYRSNADRTHFLALLSDVVGDRSWRCVAYCLLDNHYHLLIRTPHSDLPDGMQALNSTYATRFNAANGSAGHVFQGRYDARLVRSQEHALEVIRYIALNPVRAGLCPSPDAWSWSSYRATARLSPAPAFLDAAAAVALFGDLATYVAFVNQPGPPGDPEAAAMASMLASGRVEDILRAHIEAGYSIRAIASHLGVHHSRVARILRARNAPKGV